MADDNNLPQDDNLAADAAHVAGEMTDTETVDALGPDDLTTLPAGATPRPDAELADLKDKYLRQAAEFENYKRRTTKERLDLYKTANQELMTALLPVLDDFERARAAVRDTPDQGYYLGDKVIRHAKVVLGQ